MQFIEFLEVFGGDLEIHLIDIVQSHDEPDLDIAYIFPFYTYGKVTKF